MKKYLAALALLVAFSPSVLLLAQETEGTADKKTDAAAAVPAPPQVDLGALEQAAVQAAVVKVEPSVVRIETIGGLESIGRMRLGTGPTSGLIISPEGYIVSSAFNFIGKPTQVIVQLGSKKRYAAKQIATDHRLNLTLLKIEPEGKLVVPEMANPQFIKPGQWAIAVGRTFELEHPNPTVGVVSALGRIWGRAIQTDAATNPNNYGGPLLDIHGRVMGIVAPLDMQSQQVIAGHDRYDSGIGFAISNDLLLASAELLKKGEDLEPGLLAIGTKRGNPAITEAIISKVLDGTPLANAGIKEKDKIVALDKKEIGYISHLKRALAMKQQAGKEYEKLMEKKRLEAEKKKKEREKKEK